MSISSIDQLFADALERQKQASEESNAALERRLDPSQYLMSEEEKAQSYESSLWDYPRDAGLGIAQTGASIFTSMVDAAAALGSGIVNANAEKMADVGLIDRPEKPVDFNRAMYESGWWNPKAVSDTLQDLKSPRRKAQSREIAAADGAWETGKAYLSRPYSAFMDTVESTPYMVGTGFAANVAAKAAAKEAVAKGLTDKALKSYVNKEAVNAGANMEGTLSGLGVFQDVGQHNLENGDTFASNESVLAALAAKAGTKGLSKVNPMEATLMANRATKGLKEVIPTVSSEPKSLLRSTASFVGAPLKSITKEGLMEEGPQNVLEGVVTRAAKGKDPGEGVGSEFMQGAILGGVTGGLLHYPTHGFGSRGTVEDAVNNGSQTQQPAQRQPRQAIPLLPYDRPLGADGSGGVMVGPGSDSPSPRMRLNPEEQAQTTEAIKTGVANPAAQDEAPVETQQPQMSPEEAELARMNAEDAARRQAVIDKYGLEFNREHGAAFADVTRNITDEAEKDFHAKILQAAGMMGIKNPFKEKEAAANFATEYKTFGGDLAKLAEFYRNIGIKAENDAGKKQGALRQAEFYQQLADLLEGGELLNFEQRRARKEEKKAVQAAEIQAAQVQQTAEQMMAQEAAPVETQPEVKTQPKPEAQSEIDSTIPSEEELSTLEPDRKRNYRGKVAAIIARLESEGKISPEQKEQVYRALNNVRKGGSQLGAYKAAISKLRSIENPPPKKVKPESGLERAQKDAIKRTANSILTSAENFPASVGYTPEQRNAFKLQHAGLVSIQKSKFSASKKELDDWAEAHAVGDFERASAIYDKYKARQRAKAFEPFVKDLEEDTEGRADFLEAINKRDWQQAVNIAENTMGLEPKNLFESVKAKKAIISESSPDGEYELATEDSYENEPSRLLAQREADENDLTKVGGQVTTDAISIEPYKGEIAPDVRETAKMLYEDREGLDAALSREGDKQDQSVMPLYYALLEQAMQAKDNAMARKLASMIKRIQKKPTQLENEKRDEAPKLTKEEAKKGEAATSGTSAAAYSADANLYALGKSVPRSEASSSGQLDDADQIKTSAFARDQNLSEQDKATTDKEPVVINATIPESPFERKEEAPKKPSFGEALKKAFDEAKAEAKKPEPVVINKPPKFPGNPFKNDLQAETEERFKVEAEMAEKDEILTAMERYLQGKRTHGIGDARIKRLRELDKKGRLSKEDQKLAADYVQERARRAEEAKKELEGKTENGIHASLSDDAQLKAAGEIIESAVEQFIANDERVENNRFTSFGTASSELVQAGKEKGLDLRGCVHAFNDDSINHICQNHVFDTKPAWKAPFYYEDFARIPEVIFHPDSIKIENTNDPRPNIVYRKTFPDGTVLVVEEVQKGQGRLYLTTARRESGEISIEAPSRRPTPRPPKWILKQVNNKNKASTRREITGGIQDFFSKYVLAKVMGSGKVVVCEDGDSFVDRVVKGRMAVTGKNRAETEKEVNVDRLRKSKAVFDERTGKIYLNGNFVNRGNAGSVLAHELVHLAKASPKFQETIKKLEKTVGSLMEAGLKSKDPLVKKFWEEVQQKLQNSGELNDPEERVTYFLEVYSKRKGAAPMGVKAKVQEILAKFKEWFDNFFGTKTLSEDDVATLLYRMSQDALITKQNSGGKIKSSFAGEKGMAFSERATFDKVAAEDMEKNGYDVRDIKSITGWERGTDGKWRFEIPDLKIKNTFSPEIQEKLLRGDKSLTVGDVFDAPELFAAYPQIKKASFRMGIDPMTMATLDRDTNGFYDPVGEKVVLNPANAFQANPKVAKAVNTMLHATEIIKSLSGKVDIDGITDTKTQEALKTIKGRIQEIVGAPVGVTVSGDGSSVKLEGAVSPNRVSWHRDPKTNRLAGMERRSASALRSLITDSQFKKAISDLKTADPELGRDLENYINAYANESAYAEAIEKGFSQIIKDLSGADLSTIAHEVQHAIQQEEGFAVGGSVESEGSLEGYRRLAGETEARNVSARLNMTPEERRNSLASDTEDVERDDQIVKFNDKEAASMSMSKKAPKKKDTKKDEPKKPRKQLTPEERAKKEQEKLAKMTPSQRASYERRKKIADLKKEVQKQKDFREGEAYRAQTAPSVEGYDKLHKGESLTKVVEDEIKDAKGEVKDKLTLWQKGLLYLKKAAKTFNDSFLKFTNDLVNDIGKECPAAKVWFGELLEWAKDRQMYRDEAQKIFSQFDALSKESKDEVESLLFESTTSGMWAFDISAWKDAKGDNLDGTKFAVSPVLEKRFDALSKKDPKAAMVVYDTLKHGYDRFIQIKTKIDTVGKAVFGDKYRSMIKMPKSVMPYVPLTRTGQYNVVWRSNQLKAEHQMLKKLKEQKDALEAEKKEVPSALTNAIKNTEEKIDAMERSADHYIVSRFDSLAEAGDYQKKLSNIQSGNKATLMDIGYQQKKSLTGQANIDRMLSDFEEKFEEHYGKGMGVAMRQTVQEMLLESAQKTLHSATKQRRNIAGANPHVMETFMHHANTDAWMLSNLDHGKNISSAFTALDKEVREYRNNPATENQQRATEINDTFNELSKRYSFLTQREQHSKVDDAIEGMRGFNTFSMLSLKPSYYVQNALQPIAMTMPYLSGEFTFGQTVAEMTRSYKEMKNLVGAALKTSHTARQKWHAFSSIMDAIQKSKMPKDEKDMLLDMERRNLLDLGAQADFGSFRGNNAVLKALNKGMTEIGYAARAVELANRYVTATAAYRMMKTKLLSQGDDKAKAEADAKEYAAKILSKTQGDYSGLNAPSAFNTKVGKVALQFRKFQAIQLNYFLDMLRGSFKGATEEERKLCCKQLKVAIATHFMLAGLNGVPAMTLAYMLAGALAGDDGEEDEDTVRRLLREAGLSSDMVDVILTGPMSGIGINLSNSVGAGQMLSPVPYTRKGLSEEGGMMELLTSVFGGATGSMLVKLHTGAVQSWDNSNWRPFFEALAPAGVPQIAKAIGITDMTRDKKTGKKFLTDEEITAWHRVVQALGFTPAPLERKYRMQNQAYRTQQFFKDEVADIKRRWIEAMDEHDYRAQAEIRKDVRELAKRQMSKGLKPVTMNDLMTARKTWKKEEKLMQKNHGLKLPNSQQGLARQLNKVHTE